MTCLGDDLVKAREFVTNAIPDMDMLLSDLRLNQSKAIETVLRLQVGAKEIQARAIYHATQSVVKSYQNQHDQSKIDGRLMGLYKLIAQYAQGLDEIAPLPAAIHSAEQTPDINTNDVKFERAKATLTELLPFAKDEAPRLSRLMSLNLDQPSALTTQISFESFMPEVTDKALRDARAQGKSVSISYSAENLLLEGRQAEQIQAELEQIVGRLVRKKIGTPKQRQNEGRPRSGHIDVCAKQGPEGLDISVLCEDETVHILRPTNFIRKVENKKPISVMEVGT